MYPFTFKVLSLIRTDKREISGVTFADNYTEAMEKIERNFGNDLIEVVNLFCLEQSDILLINDEVRHAINDNKFTEEAYE